MGVALLIGLAAPASATDIIVTGTTECTLGDQTVNWTIRDAAVGIPMTISYVVASIAGQQYPTTGWNPSVPGGGATSATTVVPALVNGRLMLNVYASWANGQTRVTGGSIDLPSDCYVATTTTTTQPEPTTTQPESTTSQPETSTTAEETPITEPETPTTQAETPTTAEETPITEPETPTTFEGEGTTVATSPSTGPHTTTTVKEQGNAGGGAQGGQTPGGTTTTTKPVAAKATLPVTGSTTTYLMVFAVFVMTVGGSILMHKRNTWLAHRGEQNPQTTGDVRRRLEQKKRALRVYLPPK